MSGGKRNWCVKASNHSLSSINPMRELASYGTQTWSISDIKYNLSWDDTSVLDGVQIDQTASLRVNESLILNEGNGMSDPIGLFEAREALAETFSYENIRLAPDDVFLDHGASGVIFTLLKVMLNPGDSIIIPSPGFALYNTIASHLGATSIMYKFRDCGSWEIDLDYLDRILTGKPKIIVIVNPSNVCGSVFSREHCLEILGWAKKNKVCVLADECHEFCTYTKPFFPFGSLTHDAPVFTVGGLSKMLSVPGWRVGWLLIYDKMQVCGEIKSGIIREKEILLHPPTFIMKAIKPILQTINLSNLNFQERSLLGKAELIQQIIRGTKELKMVMPEAAAYAYFSIDVENLSFKSDLYMYHKLAEVEKILIVPAEALLSECGFRITLQHSNATLQHCFEKITEFIANHRVST